mmetsp:Transcript_54118/g.127163  ORF Transcript_54118/g.127163 Transcript_54118/m.127163 type:complete len:269 (+) Transcript_54118:31-837(+)
MPPRVLQGAPIRAGTQAVRYAAAPRPHQQALLPMPTFGQQPMAIVAGQVVDAGVDDEGVVQGRIERGPWHETDLDYPEDLQLERGDTAKLVKKYKGLDQTLLVNSLVIIILYFLTSAAYFWYAQEVPRSCNVDLRSCFMQLGVCQAVLGLTMACFLGVAHKMLWALYHRLLAQKYRLQARNDEADSEESDYEEQASAARTCLSVPRTVHSVATLFVMLFWVHGVSLALMAKDSLCGHSTQVFWLLAFITFITVCYAAVDSSGRAAIAL